MPGSPRRNWRRSARLFGAAEGLLETAGAPVYNYYILDHSLYERNVVAVRSRLHEQTWTAAWNEGQAMDFEQAVAFALGGDEAVP